MIIQQCMREDRPLPQRIQNAPQLAFGMQLYFDAFLELSSCRQIGQALGPIPWTAINDYAIYLGLDEDQQEDMHHFVRELDNEYVRHESKKASASIKNKK